MGSFIASLATILILAMSGAFIAPHFIDWNQFKPQIEDYASEALGRPVRVDGDVRLTLLPEMRFRADRVAILDPSEDASPMFQADAIDLSLSFSALLNGAIEAKELEVERPVVRVSTDAAGKANWAGLRFQPYFPAYFAPSSFAAKSVRIREGRLIYEPAGNESLQLSGLTGSLQADAPEGPYRFTGALVADGKRLGLNAISAGFQEGMVLFRATVEGMDRGLSVNFDGGAGLPNGMPTLTGRMRGATAVAIASNSGEQRPVDLHFTGRVAIDPHSIALSETELTLDPNGVPQVLNLAGRLDLAAWKAEADVAGKVLNWKTLTAPQRENGSRSAASFELNTLAAWLTEDPTLHLRAKLRFDQIVTGDEIVEHVNATVARVEGRWLAENVSARLPGDTEFLLAGTVAGQGKKLSGIVDLQGRSFSRFVKWLSPGTAGIDTRLAQNFTLKGSVVLEDTLVSLEGVKGQIGGVPFSGRLLYDSGGNGKLALSFNSERLDLSGLDTVPFLNREDLPSILRRQGKQGEAADDAASGGPVAWLATMDEIDLNVDVDRIDFRSFQAEKLVTRLRVQSGLIDVSALNFETSDGLTVKADGRLNYLEGALQGKLKAIVEASTPDAVEHALSFAGWQSASQSQAGYESLSPARISLQIAAEEAGGEASFDATGSLGASKIRLNGKFEQPAGEGEQGRLTIDSEVTSLDGDALIGQSLALAGYPALPSRNLAPGKLSFRASGPLDKLEGTLGIATVPVIANATGIFALKGETSPGFDGNFSLQFSGAEDYFPKAALLEAIPGSGRGLSLKAKLSLQGQAYRFSNLTIETPDNRIGGDFFIDRSKTPSPISADLKGDTISLRPILALLLGDRSETALAPDLQSPESSFWSDRPFRLSAFRAFSGKVDLAAKRLEIADSFEAENARLAAKFENDAINITQLRGAAFHGDLRASGAVKVRNGKIAVEGKASLGRVQLSAFGKPGQSPLIAARASGSLDFSAEGLSPRGVVSGLSGKGRLTLGSGNLNRLLPSGTENAAATALKMNQPLERFALEAILDQAITNGSFKFRPLKATVSLSGGTVTVKNAVFRNRSHRVRLAAHVDLLRQWIDAEWLLNAGGQKSKWPPVRVVHAGPLAEVASLERKLDIDALFQAFTIRKMEKDVETLERLSRLPRQPSTSGWEPRQERTPAVRPGAPLNPGASGGAAPRRSGDFSQGGDGIDPAAGAQAFREQIRAILQQHAAKQGEATSSSPAVVPTGPIESTAPSRAEVPARRPTRPQPTSTLPF